MKTFWALLLAVCALHARAEELPQWSAGLGLGPNFSQLDAVNDELKSSIGGTLWVSRQRGWQRLDLAFDYFSLTNRTDYHALSAAWGVRFLQDWPLKPFFLLGAGIGKANNFPYAVNTNQNTFHGLIRFGVDDLYRNGGFSVGLMADYLIVKLDGNAAKMAYLGLPLLTFQYRFGGAEDEPAPAVTPIAASRSGAADSDRDGVPDRRDECPGTPAGVRVNSIGCPPRAVVKKNLRIEFASDKATVLPAYYSRIAEFAQYLRTNSDLRVTIEGHTDASGSRAHNLKLSQARADAVRAMLIGRHRIEAARVRARGYGPDRPEVRGSSPQAKQQNRRVLAVIQSR